MSDRVAKYWQVQYLSPQSASGVEILKHSRGDRSRSGRCEMTDAARLIDSEPVELDTDDRIRIVHNQTRSACLAVYPTSSLIGSPSLRTGSGRLPSS